MAVIPGVSVAATNQQTSSKYETVTTETGNYTLALLPAGVQAQIEAAEPNLEDVFVAATHAARLARGEDQA